MANLRDFDERYSTAYEQTLGSSYRELIKIIQGYGRVGSDATLADVSKLTAVGETIVSANNKFLVAVSIVQGGKKKSITPIGAELAIALQHDIKDEIAAKWRAVVDTTGHGRVPVWNRTSRIRPDSRRLPEWATGAGAVVEILKAAGLLKDEGGNLIATTPEPPSIPETVQKSLSISDSMAMSDTVQSSTQGSMLLATRIGGVQLNIDVTVQCTPKDLDDLGHKLRKVLQDFNEPGKKPEAPAPPAPAANGGAEE